MTGKVLKLLHGEQDMALLETKMVALTHDLALSSKELWGFPGSSDSDKSACSARDPGLSPDSGRYPGEHDGNPVHYSGLENPMTRGAWGLQSTGSHRIRYG